VKILYKELKERENLPYCEYEDTFESDMIYYHKGDLHLKS